MKLIKPSLLAAGAFALLAFTAPPIQAATVPNPAEGDIFLGVRVIPPDATSPASPVSYLVNLGPALNFNTATPGSTITLNGIGDIAKDLEAAYGANWKNRVDLNWSIFGVRNDISPTVYASRKQDPLGTPAAPWPALDRDTALNPTASALVSVIKVDGGYRGSEATANSPVATFQTNSSEPSSYYEQLSGSTAFGSTSQWTNIEADFGNGLTGSALDLFRISASGVTNVGTFKFNSSGKLTFTAHIASNAPPVIKFADSSFSVFEDAGEVVITLVRAGDISSPATVKFSTSNGDAVAGTDYTARTGYEVTFDAGQATTTVAVPVNSRAGYVAARSFNVSLADASGASIVGPSSATVSIADNSEIAFSETTVTVGALTSGSPSQVTLTVQRFGSTEGAATVDVSVTGGDLQNGIHYNNFADPTVVSFADGVATKTVTIQLKAIDVADLPGTIELTLNNPSTGNYLGESSTATITVVPNPGEIAFSESTYLVSKLDNSNQPSLVAVELTRSNGSVGAVTVDISASSTTLTVGTDYTLSSPTVNFGNGEVTATVYVQLANFAASTGTIELALSNPTGGATIVGTASTTISIYSSAGVLSLSSSSLTVKENAGTINIPVNRVGGSSGVISVKLSTTDETAVSNGTRNDFDALTEYLVLFNDGELTKNVPVTIHNRSNRGANKTFKVTLSGPVGTTLGTIPAATVTILATDNTKPTVSLTSPIAKKQYLKNETVKLTGSAADNKGVERVEFSLNSFREEDFQEIPSTKNGTGVTFNYELTPVRGNNTIYVRSVDAWGNVSAVQSRAFVYNNPFTRVAGSYNGLIKASPTVVIDYPAVGDKTAPSHESNGFFNVTVQATGSFSGKLSIDGLVLSVSGSFDSEGNALFGSGAAQTDTKVVVEKPTKPGLELSFNIDLNEETPTFKINGIVKQFYRRTQIAHSEFELDRAAFDGKTPATSLPAELVSDKGVFTFVIPTSAPQGKLEAQDYPQGYGLGSVTLKANGQATVSATLADGTAVTASAPLSKDYKLPVYAVLYSKLGSVGGTIKFEDKAATDLTSDDIFWFRPYQKVQHYPYGWPEGLALELKGAKYKVTAGSSVLPGLASVAPTATNATLSFSLRIPDDDVETKLNIDANNKATLGGTTTFKVTPATGIFTGVFVDANNIKPTYKGVVLQKGSYAGGYGYYLTVAPKVKDGLGEAGAVELTADP